MSFRAPAGPPVDILAPQPQTLPLVFASPHSGRDYADEFLAATHLGLAALRRSEDAFVDELFEAAPRLGAPLVRARFPRSFVDANREPLELDPAMFDGPAPAQANSRTPRVAAGLGVIPRVAANGEALYRRRLPAAEIEQRLSSWYRPYHAALQRTLGETRARFGHAVLIDCHSMPSTAHPADAGARSRVEFVLGDNHGAACGPALGEFVQSWLTRRGYRVARNQPYAGGFTTQHYGSPLARVQALQIEICRSLYMDEARIAKAAGFAALQATLAELIADLGAHVLADRATSQRAAAE